MPKLFVPILYKYPILNVIIAKNKIPLNTNRVLLVDITEKYRKTIIGNNNTNKTLSNNNEKNIASRESSLIKNMFPKKCMIKYLPK